MSFLSPRPDDLLRWRYLRRILILAAIIGLILGFYAFEAVRGRRAWQAYEKEATQRGVKLKFSEFIPPAVPDAENFASLPIFEGTFRAFETNQTWPKPFLNTRSDDWSRPSLGDSVKQLNVDLEAWQKYFLKEKVLEMGTHDPAADVLRALEIVADPLTQIREAAHRPRCRFPVHWERNLEAGLPHLSILEESARALALRISARLARNDSAAAFADFHDGLRLVTATREEPCVLPGLTRIAMMQVLLDAVWAGLERGEWNEPELRRVDEELAALDWLQDYLFTIGSERASMNGVIDLMAKDTRFKLRVFYQGQRYGSLLQGGGGSPTASAIFRCYPSGWLNQSKVRLNRYIDELTGRVDLSQRRYLGAKATPSSPGNLQGDFEKFRVLFFVMAAPVYGSVEAAKYIRIATMTDLARVACALERHRLKRGNYPAQLADLAPEFMAAVPAEIVNGDPYRYRLENGGRFVLYSVGLDLNDDGGEILPKVSPNRQRDWVWRYPTR